MYKKKNTHTHTIYIYIHMQTTKSIPKISTVPWDPFKDWGSCKDYPCRRAVGLGSLSARWKSVHWNHAVKSLPVPEDSSWIRHVWQILAVQVNSETNPWISNFFHLGLLGQRACLCLRCESFRGGASLASPKQTTSCNGSKRFKRGIYGHMLCWEWTQKRNLTDLTEPK